LQFQDLKACEQPPCETTRQPDQDRPPPPLIHLLCGNDSTI